MQQMTGYIELTKAKNILQKYTLADTLNGDELPKITQNMVHKMCKEDKNEK